jgi:GTP pyrophosphokinase
METLDFVREEKQRRIAKETLDIYVPIASRLGIYVIKSALEDLCFKHLHPDLYNDIDLQLSKFGKERSKYINSVGATLKRFLTEQGYNAIIESRVKTHYSIYRKLKRKGKSNLGEIFDIYAVRVILPTELKLGKEENSPLYQVLGAIHGKWTPLAVRFKDYIAVPKPNGYRSLHTTVIGIGSKLFNEPVEIQIRSEKMHQEAEFGIASHWLYEDTDTLSTDLDPNAAKIAQRPKKSMLKSQLAWLKALEDLQKEVKNNSEFREILQNDLFNDRIFVLTPKGDVKDLPLGATPIDFAYAVHTDVGHYAFMAKVNGSVVPLDYELKNGQVVEMLTKKNSEPNPFWLSFVKTNSAKNRIKSWFKSKDFEKNLKSGKELLNKYLEKIGKPLLDTDYSIIKKYGAKRLTFKEREDVLSEIGVGAISPSLIIKAIYPLEDLLQSTQQVEPALVASNINLLKSTLGEVVVDGQTGIPFKFATCCKPKRTDQIIGYVNRGKAITVHRLNCKMVKNNNLDRLISVNWVSEINPQFGKYKVNLVLELEDRIGLLRDITNIVSDENVNIVDLSLQKQTNGSPIKLRHLIVELDNYDQLEHLLYKLEQIPNVLSAKKIDG